MTGFGGMNEQRRCTGRGKCGGGLGADMGALADAGQDHSAALAGNDLDRVEHRVAQFALEAGDDLVDADSRYSGSLQDLGAKIDVR